MEHWFQNTRGLVIVVLAVVTCAVLLAIEPGDGFPTGVSSSPSGDDSVTVTTTVTTLPQGGTTTTTVSRPTIQEGTPDTGSTSFLQQQLALHGYAVTIDGSFGAGTTTAVKQFQADNKLAATGIVDEATWNALLKAPTTTGTTTTTAP